MWVQEFKDVYQLYLDLKRKGLKEEKYDNFEVFRRDFHWKIDKRSKLYCEYLYRYVRDVNIEFNEPCSLVFRHFSKFEPQTTQQLNDNLSKFLEKFHNENHFSLCQRKIVVYLLKFY